MNYLVIKGNYQAYSNSVKDAIKSIKNELINNLEGKLISNPYFKVYDVSELDDDTTIQIFDEHIAYELNHLTIVDEPTYLTQMDAMELEAAY